MQGALISSFPQGASARDASGISGSAERSAAKAVFCLELRFSAYSPAAQHRFHRFAISIPCVKRQLHDQPFPYYRHSPEYSASNSI